MDRLDKLEREVAALTGELSSLKAELSTLKVDFLAGRHPIEVLLAQRGCPVLSHGDPTGLILPANCPPAQVDTLYQLMRRYSFRLFLRDLIQFPKGESLSPLCRYCSVRTARAYLSTLAEIGIVRWDRRGAYELGPRRVISFGPTLEWYVCELFRREFLAPALYGVRLQMTRHGGDYDVISCVTRQLLYVEVKSSPPRGIESPAVNAFLRRLQDLRPHLAIFLVDTQLRMKDKIVPMFEEAMGAQREDAHGHMGVHRLVNEIFHVGHALFLVNSQRGIYSNLRLCIQDFLRTGPNARIPGLEG